MPHSKYTKNLPTILGAFIFLFIFSITTQATSYYGVNYSTALYDNFEYSATLSSNNWTLSYAAGCTGIPTTPFSFTNVTGGTLALGVNRSVGSCSTGLITWTRTQSFPTLFANSVLDFQLFIGSDHVNSTGTILSLRCGTNNNAVNINTAAWNADDNTVNVTIDPIGRSGDGCFIYRLSRGTIHQITLLMNYNQGTYSLFVDNVQQCADVDFGADHGSAGCIQGIVVFQRLISGTGMVTDEFKDNIFIGTTEFNSSKFAVNQPCTSDLNCSSGYCFQGVCQYKLGNMVCNSGGQCQSGQCLNGLCTNPSLSQNVNIFRDQFFGTDSTTSNILSLIIMFGIAAVFAFGLHNVPVAAAIMSASSFFILGFLFAMMGWLSAWIIFGLILLLIAFTVGAIVLSSRISQGGGG